VIVARIFAAAIASGVSSAVIAGSMTPLPRAQAQASRAESGVSGIVPPIVSSACTR
jgi:hypothetical protein